MAYYEIYHYTGDMANESGKGEIIAVEKGQFGINYKIKMDDGQVKNIPHSAFSEVFSGNYSTRFVTEKAYNEWRADKLKTMAA